MLGGRSVAALTAVGSSRVFVPAADPLFCSAKKVGQKRRPLRWRSALRTDCTRRQGLKREASETRCAQTADASLSVSVPGDASPSNGDSRQRQIQLQLSLRGAMTIKPTVASASETRTPLPTRGSLAGLGASCTRPPVPRQEE